MTVIPFRKKPSHLSIVNENFLQTAPPTNVAAIGIDLGTTNSVVSIYTPNKSEPETLLFDGLQLVPSMLFFDPTTNTEVIGAKAEAALESNPHKVIRSTKRTMGSIARNFFSEDKSYSPEDVATFILQHLSQHPVLQQQIQEHGGVWAVVTVPAHFDDAARQATIQAAKRANINVLRIINEPTAAALAYSMLPDVRNLERETLAIFDFGGGTFDVSIVDREGLIFNVLASEGDIYLGGDDLDNALAHHLREHVKPVFVGRRADVDSALFRKLLHHAETAKIAFESQGEYRIVDNNLDGLHSSVDVTISRVLFDDLTSPLIQRTIELTEQAMHAARRSPKQISRILLVGGSTRLSLVRKMLEAYFPQCLIDARLEPDLAVSWGASVQAGIILGIEPNTILVDVCSYSLGIAVAEDIATVQRNFQQVAKKFGILNATSEEHVERVLGSRMAEFNKEIQMLLHVAQVIHRNSPLPARRSEFFSTLYANQSAVHVIVVQGESEVVAGNRLIGAFLFDLQQPCPKGSRCEIQLTYDTNGMVQVLAKQIGTSNEAEAQFDSRTGEVKAWKSINTKVENSIPILNGIIVQAHKVLSTLNTQSDYFIHISTLLANYEKLLKDARSGADNDDKISFIEESLLLILEKVKHNV